MIASRNHFASQRRVRRLMPWCTIFAALLLSACGKKGPLYLPQDTVVENPPAVAVISTPVLSKKD